MKQKPIEMDLFARQDFGEEENKLSDEEDKLQGYVVDASSIASLFFVFLILSFAVVST